jgi:hypothetical protein
MKILLILSVILNIALAGLLLFTGLEGCAEIANGRLGTLTRDVEVGQFDSGKVIFKLPKGLVVREASATGEGWFEPHRFRLIITSEDEAFVDYSAKIQPQLEQHGEHYSADVRTRQSLNAGTQSHDR